MDVTEQVVDLIIEVHGPETSLTNNNNQDNGRRSNDINSNDVPPLP